MTEELKLSLDDEKLADVGRALSVQTRIEILRLLCEEELNVQEIAERLGLAVSSAASHINALEKAGLVMTQRKSAQRGSMKVCKKAFSDISISLTSQSEEKKEKIISMPVGYYTDYKVFPTCGLAGREGMIGTEDEPKSFFHPERGNAQILWLGKGYVEYRFPADALDGREKQIEISAEMCSEAPDYALDYPSDITLWVNGKEVATFTCPGDFGGRRGKLNPAWWPDKNTQFGMRKRWKITKKGTYLDDCKVSDQTLKDYHLDEQDYVSVKFGIKEDAQNCGGLNLFGEEFGDYPQNIEMKIV